VVMEPSEPNAYFWRARCHEVLGDADRALANYRRAAALQPDSMDVLHALAKTLSEHGEPHEAKAAWNRLIALAPGYVDFHLGRASQLEEEGDFDAALVDYDRAVELDPETHSLRFSRASIRGIVERFKEAAEDMQRACERAPDTPLYLRGLGEMLTRSDRPELALAPLSRTIELEPSAEGFTFRARAHRALGDSASALSDLDRALELDPNDKLAACERLNLLVTTFPKEEVGGRVMDEIERLATAMPEVAPFAALYATVLTGRGDNEGALSVLDRALAAEPDVDGQIYLERATAHARLNHVQEAFDDATRAIERSPELGAAYVARGIYRTHLQDDSAAALADLGRALELDPEDLAAHYHRGEILWNMEDYAGALAERDKTIALAPGLGHVYFERTLCREMMEEGPEGWREANMADYERAMEHGFRDVEVFVHKAIAQQEVDDLAAAVATLDAGAAEHPEEGLVYHYRAQFRGRLGDVDGAARDLARSKELGFDGEEEEGEPAGEGEEERADEDAP
jgi:tetratricopeptide (TPR) repeat protein